MPVRPCGGIGDRCLIGKGSGIVGHLSIEIGDDVWTGHHVYITDQNHGYEDLGLPISRQVMPERPVVVGDGSWLGYGTVVLPGARSAATSWSAPTRSSSATCPTTASPSARRPGSSAATSTARAGSPCPERRSPAIGRPLSSEDQPKSAGTTQLAMPFSVEQGVHAIADRATVGLALGEGLVVAGLPAGDVVAAVGQVAVPVGEPGLEEARRRAVRRRAAAPAAGRAGRRAAPWPARLRRPGGRSASSSGLTSAKVDAAGRAASRLAVAAHTGSARLAHSWSTSRLGSSLPMNRT